MDGNLIFLNNFDRELPPEMQKLYRLAEEKLADNKTESFSALADHPEFQEHCSAHGILHMGGPMIGSITDSSVNIWVRTVKPEAVTVTIDNNGETRSFGPVETTLDSKLSAVVTVSGLSPNTRYSYRVCINSTEIAIPKNANFKTLPVPGEVHTRIVFGSCFHRWGLGNEMQSSTIISRDAHAFLGLGDIAVQDRGSSAGLHSLDFLARDLYPAWQNLVSHVPFYAIWDDHDYMSNDGYGGSTAEKEVVWRVFRSSWINPAYGFGEEGKGVFFRTRIGAADVIMLDNRYFRTKDSFLGQDQMQWLEKELLDCEGPFIILGNGSMWSDYVSNGKDSWGTFDPEERERIFDLIEKNGIGGVLLISGDRHGARSFGIPRPSGLTLYEFEAASLGALGGAKGDRYRLDNTILRHVKGLRIWRIYLRGIP